MDHAEAHERLGDLALEPARLAALDSDPAPDAARLRAHVASCEECRTELESLRRTDAAIRDAIASSNRGGPAAILTAPAALRERVLAAARSGSSSAAVGRFREDAAVAATPGGWRRWLPAALAAVVVIAIGLGTALTVRMSELQAARSELEEFSHVTATLDRILADKHHVVVALRAADGTPGGTIAWNRSEVVVLSTYLERPPEGRQYRCWIEENGRRWPVGSMHFSGSTAYWSGPLDDWNASFQPGSRFGVTLIPSGGDALPVLVAEF